MSIDCRVANQIARVTINRPAKMNALTMTMWKGLAALMDELAADPSVGVIVVTGAGRHFSAGADIDDLPFSSQDFDLAHQAAERAVAQCPKPVLAAIRGNCIGGGCEIAVAADVRFADHTATFGVTASRLGVVYPAGPTQRLVQLIGLGAARRVLYAGELFDVDWAQRVGLVQSVAADPLEEAVEFARLLLLRSPTTIRAAKQLTSGGPDQSWPDDDYREGVDAYRAGRLPAFSPTTRRIDDFLDTGFI